MGRLAVTNTLPCFLELCIPSLPLIHLSTLKFDVLVSPSLLNISDALNPPALYCFLFCCRLIRIKSSMLKLPKNQTKICLYKGDNLPVNSRAAEPWESFLSWCLDTKGFPAPPIRPTGSWMCRQSRTELRVQHPGVQTLGHFTDSTNTLLMKWQKCRNGVRLLADVCIH